MNGVRAAVSVMTRFAGIEFTLKPYASCFDLGPVAATGRRDGKISANLCKSDIRKAITLRNHSDGICPNLLVERFSLYVTL